MEIEDATDFVELTYGLAKKSAQKQKKEPYQWYYNFREGIKSINAADSIMGVIGRTMEEVGERIDRHALESIRNYVLVKAKQHPRALEELIYTLPDVCKFYEGMKSA